MSQTLKISALGQIEQVVTDRYSGNKALESQESVSTEMFIA